METMLRHVKLTCMLALLLLALVMFMTALQINAPAQVSWFKTKGFDEERYDTFMQHVNVFHRKLKGCPPTGFPPAITCAPGNSIFDAKEWKIITEQAQSLFAQE